MRLTIQTALLALSLLATEQLRAQTPGTSDFSPNPSSLIERYVDPASGSDSNSGTTRESPLRTVTAAWSDIPENASLADGVRINLLPGSYGEEHLPNYWENRQGTLSTPIIIRAIDGSGTVLITRDLNIATTSHLYLYDLAIIPASGGDAFHCERCDHLLLKRLLIRSDKREAQETLKINQSSDIYIEDSDISGAGDNAVDYVAVQRGHVLRSRIHGASDWCMYAKGGSAQLLFESNEIHDCGTGGFTAGQGTGFEFMVSPWLHYEAYDLKFVNNIVHDTEGAAVGINGGYNILLAFNSFYRVGSRSHAIEVVFGERSCDGDTSACSTRLSAGGWGTLGSDPEPVPNRNIYIFNNVLLNPGSFRSADQIFSVQGPRIPGSGTNIPSPASTDTNLRIQGNVILNGAGQIPLGIEGDSDGCRPENTTCNEAQLIANNELNTVVPDFTDPEGGDFRPSPGGALGAEESATIPGFAGDDAPSVPLVTVGVLSNTVLLDRGGLARDSSSPPGAYASYDSPLGGLTPIPEPDGASQTPSILRVRLTPKAIMRGGTATFTVRLSSASDVSRVQVIAGSRRINLRRIPQTARYQSSKRLVLTAGRYELRVRVELESGGVVSGTGPTLRVKRRG